MGHLLKFLCLFSHLINWQGGLGIWGVGSNSLIKSSASNSYSHALPLLPHSITEPYMFTLFYLGKCLKLSRSVSSPSLQWGNWGSGKSSEGAELSFNDFLSTLIWFIFTIAASSLLCQSQFCVQQIRTNVGWLAEIHSLCDILGTVSRTFQWYPI